MHSLGRGRAPTRPPSRRREGRGAARGRTDPSPSCLPRRRAVSTWRGHSASIRLASAMFLYLSIYLSIYLSMRVEVMVAVTEAAVVMTLGARVVAAMVASCLPSAARCGRAAAPRRRGSTARTGPRPSISTRRSRRLSKARLARVSNRPRLSSRPCVSE